MAAPPGFRLLAWAAACTLAGLAAVSWASFGSPASPDAWMGLGVALLAVSALLHWRSSSAGR